MPFRGELAVFLSVDQKTMYVKRVVGLPGDKIEIRNGVLFLNGTESKQTLTDDRKGMESIDSIETKRVYLENIAGYEHLFTLDSRFDGHAVRSFGPVTVPEGHIAITHTTQGSLDQFL